MGKKNWLFSKYHLNPLKDIQFWVQLSQLDFKNKVIKSWNIFKVTMDMDLKKIWNTAVYYKWFVCAHYFYLDNLYPQATFHSHDVTAISKLQPSKQFPMDKIKSRPMSSALSITLL